MIDEKIDRYLISEKSKFEGITGKVHSKKRHPQKDINNCIEKRTTQTSKRNIKVG